MFRPVPAEADFTALEAEELARWAKHRVFERSVELRAGAEPWVFYEGPPTANGRPGLHHVWARVYKDLFCRYRTMRGYAVPRKAGWDTHGLPVEVEVEKQLGITAKHQIEDEVGIAEFTRLCRESVRNYVDEWQGLTERIGYWIDSDGAYWTFSPEYVESVWWNLKNLWDQGLLYEDIKVVPYCPRCGTALSSHELGQPDVYRQVVDESAYVRFPLLDEGDAADRLRTTLERGTLAGLSLVVWTTTPWTLLSNTGAAVGPDLSYARGGRRHRGRRPGDPGVRRGRRARPAGDRDDLVGLHYERPFDRRGPARRPAGRDGWRVVAGRLRRGRRGDRHRPPGPGLRGDRPAGGPRERPPHPQPGRPRRAVHRRGALARRPGRAGHQRRGQRPSRGGRAPGPAPAHAHPYPHCWRCDTPLIYWGKPSWYIRTSDRKADLVAQNQTIGWHPEHIRDGRMGEWLANNVDWALSRDRYWGTPLPIWRCAEGHLRCVGSLAELSELAGRDVSDVDPHRPDIDAVTFACAECAAGDNAGDGAGPAGGVMRRVEPVIDAWFDSGSMPSAQWGYPVAAGSADQFVFPADFICEAIDQTRGWFYSLLAVNTLVRGATPYRNVLCLGHIVDADGRKMSKSVGNVIDPWEILSTRGADPLRWWMFSQGSPWTPTRVSFEVIDAAMRDTLLTLWNTWSFFTTYASLNEFDPADPAVPAPPDRSVLDRWMRSRLHATVAAATESLDGYEPFPAATAIAELVDDVSNWYVRRSRRRFWRTDPDADPADSLGAQATLHEVLVTVARTAGPDVPVPGRPDVARSDRRRRGRLGPPGRLAGAPTRCPRPGPRRGDGPGPPPLLPGSGGPRRGRDQGAPAAGPGPGLPSPGQPDPARRGGRGRAQRGPWWRSTAELGDVLAYELVPNFKLLGPRLGARVQQLRAAMGSVDGAAAAADLAAGRPVVVDLRRRCRRAQRGRGRAAGPGPARVRRVTGRGRGGRPRPGHR